MVVKVVKIDTIFLNRQFIIVYTSKPCTCINYRVFSCYNHSRIFIFQSRILVLKCCTCISADEKDRDSVVTTIWKSGLKVLFTLADGNRPWIGLRSLQFKSISKYGKCERSLVRSLETTKITLISGKSGYRTSWIYFTNSQYLL
jgi:hypothetical protein